MTADPLRALEELAQRVESLLTAWGELEESEKRDAIAADIRSLAAALSQAGAVDGWVRLPRGDAEKLARFAANNAGNGLRSEVSAAGRRVQALLAAAPINPPEIDSKSGVPDGWVLVPSDPTPEMLAKFWCVCTGADWGSSVSPLTKRQLGRATKAYAAMLAAAPAAQGVDDHDPMSTYEAYARGVNDGRLGIHGPSLIAKPAMYQQIHRHLENPKWEECDKATYDQFMAHHRHYGGEPPVRALYAAAPAVAVDEAMVERAAREMQKYEYAGSWDELKSVTQSALKEEARRALAAALWQEVGRG